MVGGATGRQSLADLADAHIRACFHEIPEESRRTVVVSEADGMGTATSFHESGPTIDSQDWDGFLARYSALVPSYVLVVLSGSLPPGLPIDAYATLADVAHAAGPRVILDTSGPALVAGLLSHPEIVKPNLLELAQATDTSLPADSSQFDSVLAAGESLQRRSTGAVVVSMGPRGLLGLTGEAAWLASAPEQAGNATGAGDAVVAALAEAELRGLGGPDSLCDAGARGV